MILSDTEILAAVGAGRNRDRPVRHLPAGRERAINAVVAGVQDGTTRITR